MSEHDDWVCVESKYRTVRFRMSQVRYVETPGSVGCPPGWPGCAAVIYLVGETAIEVWGDEEWERFKCLLTDSGMIV